MKIKSAAILNEKNSEFFSELMKKGVDAVEPEMEKQHKSKIRQTFENFWEVKSLNKKIRKEDKENYYGFFLDGYGIALLIWKKKRGAERNGVETGKWTNLKEK